MNNSNIMAKKYRSLFVSTVASIGCVATWPPYDTDIKVVVLSIVIFVLSIGRIIE